MNKLQTLKEKPELAIFDELTSLNDSIEAIKTSLSNIELDEIKTYEDELEVLSENIMSLEETLKGKDMLVNVSVPLDDLIKSVDKVEKAIKNIKEVEIPQYPDNVKLTDTQINELLLSIQSIPEFPKDEFAKLLMNIENSIKEIKIEIPEQEGFDYELVDRKFKELLKAIESISISVSGGGGLSSDNYFKGTDEVVAQLSDGTQKTQIVDASGNVVDVISVNGNMGLVISCPGHVSTENSSTTPLLADAVFTGEAVNILNYGGIGIMVNSDVASAAKGLVVQYTFEENPSDSDWHDGEKYTIPAGSTKFFTPPKQGKYLRVKYTNGGSDQTELHLHTFLSGQPFKWSSHNLQDSLNDEDDGELVVAVPKLRTAANNYVSQQATTAGNAKVSLEELESGISVNNNTQLKVTQYDSSGNEISGSQTSPVSNEIIGVDWISGNSGVDSSTETLQTIDYAHHEIHSGSNYRVQAFDDAIPATGSGGELVIGFFVPNQTKLPHMMWEFVHEGNMTMKLLEGVTLTLETGTDVLCKNSRRDAGDTSVLQGVAGASLTSNYVTKNPTYSGGTVVSLKREYATRNEAGGGARRAEVILKANTYYAFVLDNNETTTQGGQIRLEWYEHSDKN